MDASSRHEIIEVIDDYDYVVVSGHTAISSNAMLKFVIADEPLWADLTWTPDLPPERV